MALVKIIGQVAVKVIPDTTKFKDELKDDLKKIKRQIGDLEIDVVPQITKASKEKVKAELKALQKELDGKNIEFDLGLNDSHLAAIEAELDAVARDRKANINVDVDGQALRSIANSFLIIGGARFQIEAVKEALEALGRIDFIAVKVAMMAAKITMLGGAAIAASGQILSLVGGLVKIGPAGLALPGLLGGMAVGLGITITAFAGFKKALPGVVKEFTGLKTLIQTNFWDKAAGPIRAWANDLFPILRKAIGLTSTALGEFFGAFATALGKSLDPALEGMFAALTKSVQITTKHVDSFANIITILGNAGAQFLPALARWFGRISDTFSAFLTKADKDGSLKGWITTGITNLQALGNVVKGITGIFAGLVKAASKAGGASLTEFGNGLVKISGIVNSQGFQDGLVKAFSAAYSMMHNITSQAGPALRDLLISIVDTFSAVGPGLADGIGGLLKTFFEALNSPDVQSGALGLFDSMNKAIAAIQPTIKPVVSMIASLGPVFGALIENIAVIGANGMNRFAKTVTEVSKALVPLINHVGDFFNDIGNALIPVFEKMAENIVKIVKALVPLTDSLHKLWNLLAPVLIPVLKLVVSILGDALLGVIKGVTMVINGLVKIIKGVIEVFNGLKDVVVGIFTGDFSKVGKGFGEIFSGLKDIVLGALEAVAGAIWGYLNGTVVGLFRRFALKAAEALLPKFALGAIAKFLGPLKDIADLFVKPFIKAKDAVKPFFDFIVKGAKGMTGAADTVFGRFAQVVKFNFDVAQAAFKPLFDALGFIVKAFKFVFGIVAKIIETYFKVWATIIKAAFDVIKFLFEGGWKVVRVIFKAAFDFISAIVRGIIEFFSSSANAVYETFKGPWDAISEFLLGLWTDIRVGVELIWNGIRDFFVRLLNGWRVIIEDAWSAISGGVSKAWNAIHDFLVGAWTRIKGVFTNALNGVKDFLATRWQNIKNNVTNVWTAVRDFIKHRWELIKADVQIVIAFIKDFLGTRFENIKNNISAVWNKVRDIISGVWSKVKGVITDALGNIKTHLADAWDAIRTKVSAAWDAVKETVSTKIEGVVEKVKGLAVKALNALKNIGSVLINAGSDLIQGFIDGIKKKFDDVRDTLGGLTKKLTSWKGPAPVDRVLLTPAGEMIIDGLIDGLESRYKGVKESLQGLTDDIAGHFDSQQYQVGIAADLSHSDLSAISGLSGKVSTSIAAPSDQGGAVHIDNITIPLEDLKQLNSLEEFLDMLRVRTRQGVLPA